MYRIVLMSILSLLSVLFRFHKYHDAGVTKAKKRCKICQNEILFCVLLYFS